MKAISLLQPWATLVVIGAKKIETRSWNTKFRGEVLIHASANQKIAKDIIYQYPFNKVLVEYFNHIREPDINDLPFGAIVGKAKIVATGKTESIVSLSKDKIKSGWVAQINWEQELAFGDYANGRYGWLLEKPVAFKYPLKINGALSLWDCDFRICKECGCSDNDCRCCIERTGKPCSWIDQHLCSACAPPIL